MSEGLEDYRSLSEIELDIGGYRAILRHPVRPPHGERFNLWECDDFLNFRRFQAAQAARFR